VATRTAEPSAGNGIWLRGSGTPFGGTKIWSSGFLFQITANNKWSLYRTTGGTPTALQAWVTKTGTPINGSGLPNTLQVVATGGTLNFYINGDLVKTLVGQTILSGKNGFGLVRGQPNPPSGDSLKIRAAVVSTSATSRPTQGTISAAQAKANDDANKKANKNADMLYDDLHKSNPGQGH